jgi:hypothetical protein
MSEEIQVQAELVDPTEERKKKIKPHVAFNITADVWDDGVLSGSLVENRQLGRKKVKYVYDSASDFIAASRTIAQGKSDQYKDLANTIEKDWETEDKTDCEVVGKVTVDIYSDGVIVSDTSEMVSGARGPKKAWRVSPTEFVNSMEALVGTGNSNLFKQLPQGD